VEKGVGFERGGLAENLFPVGFTWGPGVGCITEAAAENPRKLFRWNLKITQNEKKESRLNQTILFGVPS